MTGKVHRWEHEGKRYMSIQFDDPLPDDEYRQFTGKFNRMKKSKNKPNMWYSAFNEQTYAALLAYAETLGGAPDESRYDYDDSQERPAPRAAAAAPGELSADQKIKIFECIAIMEQRRTDTRDINAVLGDWLIACAAIK